MKYKSLRDLFYKEPEAWERIYRERVNAPMTRRLPFSVHQVGRRDTYPAFLCYTEETAERIEAILLEYLRFEQVYHELPEAAMTQFLRTSLVEEIQATNDIENVRSTRKEIRSALAAKEPERKKHRMGSVVSKYDRIIRGESMQLWDSRDIRQIYDEFLFDEIAAEDEKNLPDGKLFRKDAVEIVSGTQKVLHRGVAPESEIIRQMDQAIGLLHDADIPRFVRLSLFHFQFAYIHPFYDGNGRMNRLISSYLLSELLHPAVALQLSVQIKESRRQYYRMFETAEAESNKGDMTPFVLGFLAFICQSIQHTTEELQEKKAVLSAGMRKLDSLGLEKGTTEELAILLLQTAIFSETGLSLDELARAMHSTRVTVFRHLKMIPDRFITVTQEGRKKLYQLNLFGQEQVRD